MSANNCGAIKSNLTKLFQVMRHEAGITILVQRLEGRLPKILDDKKRPKFGAISDNFRLIANISGTDENIDKRKAALSTTIPPTFAKRKWVNFGPLTKEFACIISTHPKSTFGRPYFGP